MAAARRGGERAGLGGGIGAPPNRRRRAVNAAIVLEAGALGGPHGLEVVVHPPDALVAPADAVRRPLRAVVPPRGGGRGTVPPAHPAGVPRLEVAAIAAPPGGGPVEEDLVADVIALPEACVAQYAGGVGLAGAAVPRDVAPTEDVPARPPLVRAGCVAESSPPGGKVEGERAAAGGPRRRGAHAVVPGGRPRRRRRNGLLLPPLDPPAGFQQAPQSREFHRQRPRERRVADGPGGRGSGGVAVVGGGATGGRLLLRPRRQHRAPEQRPARTAPPPAADDVLVVAVPRQPRFELDPHPLEAHPLVVDAGVDVAVRVRDVVVAVAVAVVAVPPRGEDLLDPAVHVLHDHGLGPLGRARRRYGREGVDERCVREDGQRRQAVAEARPGGGVVGGGRRRHRRIDVGAVIPEGVLAERRVGEEGAADHRGGGCGRRRRPRGRRAGVDPARRRGRLSRSSWFRIPRRGRSRPPRGEGGGARATSRATGGRCETGREGVGSVGSLLIAAGRARGRQHDPRRVAALPLLPLLGVGR